MSFVSDYLRCPTCNKIIKNSNRTLSDLSKAAPCCGANNEMREKWSSLEAHLLLRLIHEQDLTTIASRNVAIFFLSTVMEYLLERSLRRLLSLNNQPEKLTNIMLDECRGRANRVKLFNKISDKKIKEIIETDILLDFMSKWEALVSRRNKVAHGAYISNESDTETIKYMKDNVLEAFSRIENYLSGV